MRTRGSETIGGETSDGETMVAKCPGPLMDGQISYVRFDQKEEEIIIIFNFMFHKATLIVNNRYHGLLINEKKIRQGCTLIRK